jgi:zinc protease
VSFGGQPGLLSVSVKAKRANLPAVLKLVGEILRDPVFPESEFAIAQREKLEGLAQQKTEPAYLAARAIQRKLQPYPKDNVRYVPTIEESIERVKGTTLAQVKEMYHDQLGAEAGELTAVGDFDPQAVQAELGPALTGWKARSRTSGSRSRPGRSSAGKRSSSTPRTRQTPSTSPASPSR